MRSLFCLLLIYAVSFSAVKAESIAQVRALYSGIDTILHSSISITGIVISDSANYNTIPRELHIQDSTSGISIYFSAPHYFAQGDKIAIDLSGGLLTNYNGLIQIQSVPVVNATKIGTGTIIPRMASIAEIATNAMYWQSTLLQIPCAVITAGNGTIYSGIQQVQDATGTISLFTRSIASFAANAYPTDTINFIAYLTHFTEPELRIRNLPDVQVGCLPYTPVATGIENSVSTSFLDRDEKYFDFLGEEITKEQCTLCIALQGNRTRKIWMVK